MVRSRKPSVSLNGTPDSRCTPTVEGPAIEIDTRWATAHRRYSPASLAERIGGATAACENVSVQRHVSILATSYHHLVALLGRTQHRSGNGNRGQAAGTHGRLAGWGCSRTTRIGSATAAIARFRPPRRRRVFRGRYNQLSKAVP